MKIVGLTSYDIVDSCRMAGKIGLELRGWGSLGLGGIVGEEHVHELGAVGDFERCAFHNLHCKKRKKRKSMKGQQWQTV